jgi:hypothetical protein
MQIPPNTALVNLLASLPAQGISAAPAAAKGPQPAAAPAQTAASAPLANAAIEGRQPAGFLPRGSIINIVA